MTLLGDTGSYGHEVLSLEVTSPSAAVVSVSGALFRSLVRSPEDLRGMRAIAEPRSALQHLQGTESLGLSFLPVGQRWALTDTLDVRVLDMEEALLPMDVYVGMPQPTLLVVVLQGALEVEALRGGRQDDVVTERVEQNGFFFTSGAESVRARVMASMPRYGV